MLNSDLLSRQMSRLCESKVMISVTDVPCREFELERGEKKKVLKFVNPHRRIAWLRGRKALKFLLSRLKENLDTSELRVPHERYSLTHSGPYAMGVASLNRNLGIGIDFEMNKHFREETTHFFLTEGEMVYVEGLIGAVKQKELLRLWTVKEALFKANLENSKTWYTDYVMENPCQIAGRATMSRPRKRFKYASMEVEEGFISVALASEGENDG